MLKPIILSAVSIILIVCNSGCQPGENSAAAVDTTGKTSTTSSDINHEDTVANRQYFKASGTEPFWGFTMSNSGIRLTSINQYNDSFFAPNTDPVVPTDAEIKSYQFQNASGSLAIEISRAICINEMSGDSSPYKVVLTLIIKDRKDTTTLKGCGKYFSDSLHTGKKQVQKALGNAVSFNELNLKIRQSTIDGSFNSLEVLPDVTM
jgi:uncharacterized membrane protein